MSIIAALVIKAREMRHKLKTRVGVRLEWTTCESDEKLCFYGWMQNIEKSGCQIQVEIQISIS